jgi:HlyD family type I secretion membrane fusion protein
MQSTFDSQRLDMAEVLASVNVRAGLRRSALLGLAAVLTAVGGFGLWGATVPLDSAVVAPGKVTVASKRKLVQHLDGGIVRMFAVKDGDKVKEGDVLVEFDDSRARTRLSVARAGYLGALALEARLIAERDEKSAIPFSDELLGEAAHDPEIDAMVASQTRIFEARKREFAGQTEILKSRIERLGEQITGMEAERAANDSQLLMAREELKMLEDLADRQLTTRTRVLSERREVYQLEGALGRLNSGIASARKEINETQLNLLQITKKTNTEVVNELGETQAKTLDLHEQYLAGKTDIERTVLRAPTSGTVFGSQIHTIGGVVRPGDTLLEIVPNRDQLVVEVKLRPQDVDEIAVGQDTEVRFSAFKQRTTPTLRGKVSFVSADTVSDPRSPEPFYMASVEVTGAELQKLGQLKLVPGMPAEVMIKTGQRTALAYLMQPLQDSMDRAWREH